MWAFKLILTSLHRGFEDNRFSSVLGNYNWRHQFLGHCFDNEPLGELDVGGSGVVLDTFVLLIFHQPLQQIFQ